MLNENTINERIKMLDSDIAKVSEQMQSLEKQKIEAVAMMNALQGAKQQCQSFLNELNNDEPDASDSGDVDK
jgi:peptidoglycan hydrolase CwlO-like protein